MRKTKIVCTIGPASNNTETFRKLVQAGLNIVRLNFSHGTHETHQKTIDMVKAVRTELGLPIAIMIDTKGPEIRTGLFEGVVSLEKGGTYVLTNKDVVGDDKMCKISYPSLYKDVKVGGKILIDDGLLELEIEKIDGEDIVCRILNDAEISSNKGVNVPNAKLKLEALTEKDIADIVFGIKNGVDFIAASFVRNQDDVLKIRKVLEDNGGTRIDLISKIENAEGVSNIDSIIRVSDGIMVARGDLGVEIELEKLPIVQKEIIAKCNLAQKPVITATQMLDSMIRNPRPTRAESTDIANAIFDGTDAIMLSGETASGEYPEQAVAVMSRIAFETEKALDYDRMFMLRSKVQLIDVTFAVSHATATTARDLEADAIVTATATGFTARKISSLRPRAKIIASCTKNYVRRKLSLLWGVETITIEDNDTMEQIFGESVEGALKAGFIKTGDIIVFTAGVPVGVAGATNMMRVHLVSEMLIKAFGIGHKVITGKVKLVEDLRRAEELIEEGDIVVVNHTDSEVVDVIRKAAGIISVEGGFTSHAAILAFDLEIPSVVGAKNAFEILKDGDEITLDSERGVIYKGKARVQ